MAVIRAAVIIRAHPLIELPVHPPHEVNTEGDAYVPPVVAIMEYHTVTHWASQRALAVQAVQNINGCLQFLKLKPLLLYNKKRMKKGPGWEGLFYSASWLILQTTVPVTSSAPPLG